MRSPLKAAAVTAVMAACYVYIVRPRLLTWGSTIGERYEQLPGDDIVSAPQLVATRAITINALPEAVWPWVAGHDLKKGDVLPAATGGSGYVVDRADAPRALVLAIRSADAVTSCAFVLHRYGHQTRLKVRLRLRARPTLRGTGYRIAMDSGGFLKTRHHLLTLQRRARQSPRKPRFLPFD